MLPTSEASPSTGLDAACGLSPEGLLDELPAGAVVVDDVGLIRYANRFALDLLGWDDDDAIGRSLLDVVAPDDVEYATQILAERHRYDGELLGPMRLRYVGAEGRLRLTEFWARELPDRSGYVLIVPEQSTTDVLAEAVTAISSGAPIETAIEHVVAGLAASPICGDGCLLRVDHGDPVAFTDWPLGSSCPVVGDPTQPWQLAQRTGLAIDVDMLDGVDGQLAAAMVEHGYRSVWCRPVVNRRGEVGAVVVVFRTGATPMSSNQARRLDEIVSVAVLAFDQLEDRSALEQAAFTDPLTGAASRARLQREIEAGIRGASVLYLDLDGFKTVNDRHGHEAGDLVLAEVATRLFGIVREDDLVVRVGGDEFVVVAHDADRDAAAGIAERIVSELAVTYRIELRGLDLIEVSIGVSVGVCVQHPSMSFYDALLAADEALGSAKRAGKGRFHVSPNRSAGRTRS